MFGIGSTELLVILVVALIVLGPKSLAGVSRSLGKAMGEFRKVSNDFQRTLNAEAAQEEVREKMKKRAADKEKTSKDTANANPETDSNRVGSEINLSQNLASKDGGSSPLEEAVAKAHAEASQADVNLQKNNG